MDDIEIVISDEMIEKLEALPGNQKIRMQWTPEQIKILLTYWPYKTQEGIADLIGKHRSACVAKYKELTKGHTENG